MKINERISCLRKVHGYKLREISQKTGLSVSYISDLEHGRQNPSLTTCHKIETLYGISLSVFFAYVEVGDQ